MVVPLYVPEALSERCEGFVRAQAAVAISELCTLELVSALARKVRAGSLQRPEADRIRALFQAHLDRAHFSVLPLVRRHFVQARDWIGRWSSTLRGLDALHLATAAAHGFTLATADPTQAEAAAEVGVPVILLE